ncbi:Ribonucleases P/MRP protein subunit pop1 [Coemansia sp. RSA 552]|nr:Ribonucleases P/MRP protein subunit pop1 [Coemansia sp. RSA 552]
MSANAPRPDRKRKAPRPAPAERATGPDQQPSASARYSLGKARSVDVAGFVEARSFEINALQRSLENARTAGSVRAFQTLPRHLRRRAASHNVKRVPARLRERALAEMLKSAQSSKARAGTDQLTNAKKSNRYKRRRARSVREEYELRQTGKRWLETHVWHAKRMHMKDMWGAMVAETPNERSHRAAYRAAKEKTYVHDVSYFRTLEISGPEAAIVRALRQLAPPNALTVAMKPYLAGARAAPLTLYRAGMYPLAALGPAMALWQPAADPDQPRKLLLRMHPANADTIGAELSAALSNGGDSDVVDIVDITCDLVSFELLGNQSTQLLHAVLSQAVCPDATGATAFQLIRGMPSPAVLPESVAIALRVHDPRLSFPFKVDPAAAELSLAEQQQLQDLLLHWPADAAVPGPPSDFGIWDRAACKADTERRPPEHVLNERRQKQLVPGTKLIPDPNTDVSVPILLVRTGPEALLGTRVARTDRQYIDNLAHGWTVMAPRGWGMPLWMSFNFAGARAQGLNERHHIGFEAGLPTFPANWPGTPAYDQWQGDIATGEYQKWTRRPPGKRANYLKFGIKSPFYPPFYKLLGMPGQPSTYPALTADDLECRMDRLRKLAAKKRADKAQAKSTEEAGAGAPAAADIWLLAGESLAETVTSLLHRTCSSADSLDSPAAFLAWAEPLLRLVDGAGASSTRSPEQLLKRCLVRVRLICTGRGVVAKNAPVCLPLDPGDDSVIGYAMTGSFSLARGCGMAIGACSLYGLFRTWASAAAGKGPSRTKSPAVTVRSMDGGPSIDAVLTILP